MSLESMVKYHFPQAAGLAETSTATASDSLSVIDYIAAIGMAQGKSPMGFAAFMGKVGISEKDAVRAINLLTQYALSASDKVAVLRHLQSDIKPVVMRTLATYAWMDYCHSAASVKPCRCCKAKGFIDTEIDSMKSMLSGGPARKVREFVRVLCKNCNGKGLISAACKDCHGKGQVAEYRAAGVKVNEDCKRCSGRGYERISSIGAYRSVRKITDTITLAIWEKSGNAFYQQLINKLEIEESKANSVLKNIIA